MENQTSQTDSLASQTLTEQQHFWLQHFQSYQASGKSMAEYARKHGLAVKSFYYWKKRLLRLDAIVSDTRSKPPVFHKVRIQPTPILDAAYRIRFPNGIECELTQLEKPGLEQLLMTISRLLPR